MAEALDETRRGERGAVTILVALWLPVLVLFTGLAIDVPHWFDYRRNLQTRADAAALAAGTAYGGTCFTSTPSATALASIGHVAQAYSGPPQGTPDPNLPYTFSSAAPYYNQPNLSRGTPDKFHLLLNSTQYWDAGGTNYSMTPAGNFCDSTDENGREGPMVDVRVTQAQVHSFFGFALPPLFTPFSFKANISAHARVEIQQAQSENDLRPIAVREPGVTPCATAKFLDATTNTPLLDSSGQQVTVALQRDPLVAGQPVTWSNASNPKAVTMPANGDHVSVQLFLSDCQGDGQLFDSVNGGLVWVNAYGTSAPGPGQAPQIVGDTFSGDPAPTGVTLTTGQSGCNPYFFFLNSGSCSIGVHAAVAFSVPHLNANGNPQTFVFAGLDGNTTCATTGQNQGIQLDYQGGNRWASSGGFTVASQSGPHVVNICWKQQGGTIGTTTCGGGGSTGQPCTGQFGIQQRVYSGFNDETDPPDDSGPVVLATLSEPGVWSPGADSFRQGSTHSLVARFQVSAFQTAQPGDPPTVLRFSLQNGTNTHNTGLIDCGQGNGNSADIAAIQDGCPNPLQINQRNGVCIPELSTLTPPQPDDCVHTTQGNRNILAGFYDRIDPNGTCSANNWWAYERDPANNPIPPNDPRAFTMIITSAVDLSGSGPTWAPIYDFATFYVTGWSTQGSAPSCPSPGSPPFCYQGGPTPCTNPPVNSNEPYPGTGSDAKSVWGHWIVYVIAGSGTGTGGLCPVDPLQPLNCVAVLSR